MQEHADLDRWTEEVELLEEEQRRVEVSHHKTAEAWTQIAKTSDAKTGAAAYAFKVADVHTKLADHCVREWEKALKKVVENQEEDRCMRERDDQLAREEEAKIRREDEETMPSNPDDDESWNVDEDTSSNNRSASGDATHACSPQKHKRLLSGGSLSPSPHGNARVGGASRACGRGHGCSRRKKKGGGGLDYAGLGRVVSC